MRINHTMPRSKPWGFTAHSHLPHERSNKTCHGRRSPPQLDDMADETADQGGRRHCNGAPERHAQRRSKDGRATGHCTDGTQHGKADERAGRKHPDRLIGGRKDSDH